MTTTRDSMSMVPTKARKKPRLVWREEESTESAESTEVSSGSHRDQDRGRVVILHARFSLSTLQQYLDERK
jgi:hypothetical protein